MTIFKKLQTLLIKHLPFFLILIVVLILTWKNIIPGTYYTGWDNSHPEFNFQEFIKRIVGGAWLEYLGTGAPASQAYLSEIPRLPFIFLLKLLLPNNLVRYAFNFLIIFIGGAAMYLFLIKTILFNLNNRYRGWIASFGGIFYILNLMSLQQFYINFELFAIEFAYFPLVLLAIYNLSQHLNLKSVFFLIGALVLFTPSAFTPTIFYIACIFFIIYAFFTSWHYQKNLFKTIKRTLLISAIIFFVNSYWILPNLYYLLHHSHYVQQSRANQLFNMEALWSVREAGKITNLLTGVHFLFDWKDFNFKSGNYEYIFDEWTQHLANPFILFLLIFFNLVSAAGLIILIFNFREGRKRWGIISIYLLTTVFIWLGLFFPNKLVNYLYEIGPIREAFRNPFTKMSNFYSFAITIMIVYYLKQTVLMLKKSKLTVISKFLPVSGLILFFGFLFCISWPSFKGNFLSDKLRVQYPPEYFEMFSFLRTKPKNARTLELPFLSHAGWLYYSWPEQGYGNGYQGMGFYIFGVPQPLMTPDHARWTETTDFFYHELRHALNSQNSLQLKSILNKYQIKFLIIDDTSISPVNPNFDNLKIHQLIHESGLQKIWQKKFLSIYENPDINKTGKLLIPEKITLVSAETSRVRKDYVFEKSGDYIYTDPNSADIIYPFADLGKLLINGATFTSDSVKITRRIPPNNYLLTIPNTKSLPLVFKIIYTNQHLKIFFSQTKIISGNKEYRLPQYKNTNINLDQAYDKLILLINDKVYEINNNQSIGPFILDNPDNQLNISYTGVLNNEQIATPIKLFPIEVEQFNDINLNNILIDGKINNSISVQTVFPALIADLTKNPSENCSNPLLGKIKTIYKDQAAIYQAELHGVNCNSYNFENFKPNYSYLMRIEGENYRGRSIKFFINYNVKNSLPEEYLMSPGSFDVVLSFLPVSETALKSYAINWETRSYGKTSENKLSKLQIVPFPIETISQIQLIKPKIQLDKKNQLIIKNQQSLLSFYNSVQVECISDPCYIGIDQAYDDLWIALDDKLKLLPHFRYNNWANLWQVNRGDKIKIIYIPQIISYICLITLISGITILIIKIRHTRI